MHLLYWIFWRHFLDTSNGSTMFAMTSHKKFAMQCTHHHLHMNSNNYKLPLKKRPKDQKVILHSNKLNTDLLCGTEISQVVLIKIFLPS